MTPAQAYSARVQLGLSKYAVAKALGCSATHYALYERGERQLSSAKLANLAFLFTEHPKAQRNPSQP
jgi:transcriptional regulator with XRE-family HTH domain